MSSTNPVNNDQESFSEAGGSMEQTRGLAEWKTGAGLQLEPGSGFSWLSSNFLGSDRPPGQLDQRLLKG